MKRRKQFSLKTYLSLFALCIAVLASSAYSVRAAAIKDDLKSTIDNVIQVVTNPEYKSNETTRREKLRNIINPMFNYHEMGKRALGKKDWMARNKGERQQFIDLFGKLLENSYASKIESYQDEKLNTETK